MKVIVSIVGQIGSFDDEKGVELIDVVSQVKPYKEISELEVRIDSPGGVVQTGEDIFAYIKSLNVPVTTINENNCDSIASLIFLAGNKRIMRPGSSMMIHNPWGSPSGDADLLNDYSKELRQIENRIAKFYDTIVQLGEEAIKTLMRNETVMTAQDAVKLGFATAIEERKKIAAYIKINNNMKKKSLKEQLQGIMSKLTGDEKNLTLQDANGAELVIETENEAPQIGDTATVDGAPANGEYTMPEGNVLVFVEGELTEIKEPEDEQAAIRKVVQEELEKFTAKKDEELELAVKGLNALTEKYEVLAKSVKSKYTPAKQKGQKTPGQDEDEVYKSFHKKKEE